MKVLIVEDDPGVRVLLQTLVAEEGHTVEVAVDGPAGLDAFRQLRPDLVLSDIMMPHMDGLELLESIRAEDSDVLVVMRTGCGSEEYAVRALRHGANNYLQKPIDDTDIISLVQKYAAVIQDRAVDVEIHEMFVERAFTLQLENSLEIVPRVADRLLRETCGAIKKPDQLGVRLGLVELLENAVEHGNLGISYEQKGQSLATTDSLEALCRERLSDPEDRRPARHGSLQDGRGSLRVGDCRRGCRVRLDGVVGPDRGNGALRDPRPRHSSEPHTIRHAGVSGTRHELSDSAPAFGNWCTLSATTVGISSNWFSGDSIKLGRCSLKSVSSKTWSCWRHPAG